MRRSKCNLCWSTNLEPIFDFGYLPLPNNLLNSPDEITPLFRLDLVQCIDCALLQLGEVVLPDLMFREYNYVPSASESLQRHFKDLVDEILAYTGVESGTVVDIGSNDGLMLSYFAEKGFETVGVDPAVNLAPVAKKHGVHQIIGYFDNGVGIKIGSKKAQIITATNCLGHTQHLRSFLSGVEEVLADDGVFVVEVPYLSSLVSGIQFDTIYHEHQSYFSLTPLARILPQFGLFINAVQMIKTHGGSIRLWISRQTKTHATGPLKSPSDISSLLIHERQVGVPKVSYLKDFIWEVKGIKNKLPHLLSHEKSLGHSVVGFGASAKASIILNYCSIDSDLLSYVVDVNPLKQGKYIPGVRVEIVPEERLEQDKPSLVLVSIWNLIEDVKSKIHQYSPESRLLVPIPRPRFIDSRLGVTV